MKSFSLGLFFLKTKNERKLACESNMISTYIPYRSTFYLNNLVISFKKKKEKKRGNKTNGEV